MFDRVLNTLLPLVITAKITVKNLYLLYKIETRKNEFRSSSKSNDFEGTIHLVRTESFLKNLFFLPPDTHTYVRLRISE